MSYSKEQLVEYLEEHYGLSEEPRVSRVVDLFYDDPSPINRTPGVGDVAEDARQVHNHPGYWDKAADERGEYQGGAPTWEDDVQEAEDVQP